jgi:protein-disulfide isomerase
MSKRQEIRARRQRQRLINRILVIVMVVLGVGLIAAAIIVPNLPQSTASVTDITPAASTNFTAPVNRNSIGDPNAPVKVDVWIDFQCSACSFYSTSTEPSVIKDYVETGKALYTVHFAPIISNYAPGNTESEHAANAALCAADQGKFWEYHNTLFANWKGENIGAYADNRLIAFAQSVGLKMSDFKSCFNANKYSDYIAQDFTAGQNLGINGTPSVFVNNTQVGQQGKIANYDDISAAIEAALAGK